MSSSIAEALVFTLMAALQFLQDYFSHVGHSEITDSLGLKCMTTRVIEYFLGHITEKMQGSSLRLMEMARKISNDAFCYLLS